MTSKVFGASQQPVPGAEFIALKAADLPLGDGGAEVQVLTGPPPSGYTCRAGSRHFRSLRRETRRRTYPLNPSPYLVSTRGRADRGQLAGTVNVNRRR